MKKTDLIIFLGCLPLGILIIAGCGKLNAVDGNGHVITDTRNVDAFTTVISEGFFDVNVREDTVNEITIEAEQNLIPYIYTGVSGSDLVIKVRNNRRIKNHEPIVITVKTTQLNKVKLEGSGNIYCTDITADNFDIGLSGSGNINVGLTADYLDADLSGSGEIKLSGDVNSSDLDISGSGDISAYEMLQDTCSVDISGSGSMYVHVADLLNVKISGSGKVYYKGSPVVNTDISGSGEVVHE